LKKAAKVKVTPKSDKPTKADAEISAPGPKVAVPAANSVEEEATPKVEEEAAPEAKKAPEAEEKAPEAEKALGVNSPLRQLSAKPSCLMQLFR